MSTQGHVQFALEQLAEKHNLPMQDERVAGLLNDVADFDGSVWQIIARWGETNAWERAEPLIEAEAKGGTAARTVALEAVKLFAKLEGGTWSPEFDALIAASKEFEEAFKRTGDQGDF